MIVIEDLQVSNVSSSAKGTGEVPRRNVLQKTGLNRSILDQGWFEFRRHLEYKAGWAAVTCWQYQRITPARPAQPAGMCRQRIAAHKAPLPAPTGAT